MRIIQLEYNSLLYKESLNLRNEVLRIPLNMNISDEDLSDEKNHIHFAVVNQDKVEGIVILIPNLKPKIGKLRQMATSDYIRGTGWGKKLVHHLEQYAKDNGMEQIELNARHYAVGFYEKLGYSICSDPFQEVGIQHFKMIKNCSD